MPDETMFVRKLLGSYASVMFVSGALEELLDGILLADAQPDVMALLILLAVEGGARYPGDLVAAVNRPGATVTHQLKRLTQQEFLVVNREADDARRRRIALTPVGEAVLASALAVLARGLAAAEITEATVDPERLARAVKRAARELALPKR